MKPIQYIIGAIVLLSVIIGVFMMRDVDTELTALLPDTLEGWHVASEDQMYDRETLYDYINGGAELYISYGFKRMVSRSYAKSGQPDIVLDVFDMGSARNAFGVFSHARETVDDTFGQGSQYTAGLLLFWKNRYFVSVLASPETVESKDAVFRLAGEIEAAVAEEGPLPDILALLPQPSLIKESIRYFRHHIWLNTHYFVADQNILRINENTEALLAKYGEPEKPHILLLVQYRENEDATLAYDDFVTYYLPELSEERTVQIEDGTWTACRLKGRLLIIVFNAPTADHALHLLEAVQNKAGEGK